MSFDDVGIILIAWLMSIITGLFWYHYGYSDGILSQVEYVGKVK